MRHRFSGALILCLFGSLAAADELTLDEAVQLALRHNSDVLNAALDIDKSKDRSAAVHSQLFPKLSVYMLGSEQLRSITTTLPRASLGTYPGIGPIPANDVNYTTPIQPTGFILGRVAQPLSGLYQTKLNLKALDLATQLAGQKARSKRQEVVQDVKLLYYKIEQTQGSLAATRESLVLYREIERITNDYVLKQTALESDLLQAQANLANSEQSELTLSNQIADQKEQLNQLLGRDVLTEFTVAPPSGQIRDTELDLVVARKKALAERPELQQARLKVLQSKQELRAKHAEYIPTISAEFNSVSLLNFNSFLPVGSYSVGVSLSWEPFDWGRKKSEILEKSHTVSQDENTEASTEQKVILDVNNKYRQLQQSWAKLRATKLSQRAALEALRVNKDQFEVQAALLKVVFQAQSTLAQANAGYQSGLAEYWSAKAEFEHAIGEDP